MTAAASVLNTTHPPITQRIRVLIEQLGCPVIDRKGGNLSLNGKGEAPEMQKADMAIRFGHTHQDDLTDTPLLPEAAFPVCSPGYPK